MVNAIETIVLLKWTFILKSHHLFDLGWTPPNRHTAYCVATFSPKQVVWEGERKPWLKWFWKLLSADHGFILESLVRLGTVNITCGKLPIYNTLGTGTGPLIAHEGQKKQMVGELAFITQKGSGHRTKAPFDRFDLVHWEGYRKARRDKRARLKCYRGCFPNIVSPTVFTFYFFAHLRQYFSVFYVF